MLNKLDFLQQKTLKEKIPFIIGGVFVGILGVWLLFKLISPLVQSTCRFILSGSGPGYQEHEARPVEVSVVKKGNISKRIVTVGRIKANDEVMLKSEVHGRITNILFTEGGHVQKGDVLIKFDDLDTQASLKQYKAELASHEAEFKRVSQLHSKNIQSTKQLEDIQAKRDIAAAKVEEAEATLAKKTIVAPFSGTIGLVSVSEGAYVQAGNDLAMLVNTTPVRLDFKVPEHYVRDVGPGQIAEVKVDGFPNDIFQFVISAVNSKIDEQSHSLAVRATNPNDENLLKAGLFANVSLIIGDKSDAILIPETALYRTGDIEFVWIVEKGKVGRRRVVSNTRENGKVEVVAGLREGNTVVTGGQLQLSEGAKVKVTNVNKEEQLAPSEEDEKGENPSKEPDEPQDKQEPTASPADKEKEAPAPETPQPQTAQPEETQEATPKDAPESPKNPQ